VLPETANSIEEFTKKISDLRERWFADEPLLPWCRGQERAEWPLVPKLYRGEPDDHQLEYEIREEFATRAPALSDYTKPSENPELNNWESYFVMHHYGAPTRLLDWTESSLIALYFERSGRTPVIFTLRSGCSMPGGSIVLSSKETKLFRPLILAHSRRTGSPSPRGCLRGLNEPDYPFFRWPFFRRIRYAGSAHSDHVSQFTAARTTVSGR
jgi:hypothetical protein